MTDRTVYTVIETTMGWVGILASDEGLLGTTLPQATQSDAAGALGPGIEQADRDCTALDDLVKRLGAYFDGCRVDFPDRLDMSRYTLFQRRVWEATRSILYGETRSYLSIARQTGQSRAARAVGQALGKNPFPIIVPCHRVIASNGGLCGFGGGLEMKRRLLEMEAGHPK